jgi:hypothetical protein
MRGKFEGSEGKPLAMIVRVQQLPFHDTIVAQMLKDVFCFAGSGESAVAVPFESLKVLARPHYRAFPSGPREASKSIAPPQITVWRDEEQKVVDVVSGKPFNDISVHARSQGSYDASQGAQRVAVGSKLATREILAQFLVGPERRKKAFRGMRDPANIAVVCFEPVRQALGPGFLAPICRLAPKVHLMVDKDEGSIRQNKFLQGPAT